MSTCEKQFCEKVYVAKAVDKLKKLETAMRIVTKHRKQKPLKFVNNKTKKTLYDACVNGFCNPSCKDTVMVEKNITPSMNKRFKNYMNSQPFTIKGKDTLKKMLKLTHEKVRQTIKKYNPPVKNGFYRGLSRANIKMLRSAGATSGCGIDIPSHLK